MKQKPLLSDELRRRKPAARLHLQSYFTG